MAGVTQKQIADTLGISTMTVSRALRGDGHTAPHLLERIREQAKKMGYQVNPLARSLRLAGQSDRRAMGLNLAFVVLGKSKHPVKYNSLRALTAARGHSITVFHTGAWSSLSALKRTWIAQGISGVFIQSHGHARDPVALELIRDTNWELFSLMKIGNGLSSLAINLVRSSVFIQMMTTYEKVLAGGYDRVAFIFHGSASEVDDQMRLGAVLAAQAKAASRGAAVAHWLIDDNAPLWASLFTPACQGELKRFMESFKPNAVIGFGSVIYDWLVHSGYEIPRDLGYATPVVKPEEINRIAGTLDDIIGGEFNAALQMMEVQLARSERGLPSLVQEHTVPVRWIPGTSLPTRVEARPRPA